MSDHWNVKGEMRDFNLDKKIAVTRKGFFYMKAKGLERSVYAVGDVMPIQSLYAFGLINWSWFTESLI